MMTVADWCGQYENKAEGLLTRNALRNPLEIVVSEDNLQPLSGSEIVKQHEAAKPKKPGKPFKLPGTHPEDRTVPQLPDKAE